MEAKRVSISKDGIAITMTPERAERLATEIERMNRKLQFDMPWVFNEVKDALEQQEIYPNWEEIE